MAITCISGRVYTGLWRRNLARGKIETNCHVKYRLYGPIPMCREAFFSAVPPFAATQTDGATSLRNNYYKYPAIVPPMEWIDSVPPISPMVEKTSRNEVRLYYRGAEPIKAFAFYKVAQGEEATIDEAMLIKIVVADKTLDVDLRDLPARNDDKLYVTVVDRNNNVSEWVQLR